MCLIFNNFDNKKFYKALIINQLRAPKLLPLIQMKYRVKNGLQVNKKQNAFCTSICCFFLPPVINCVYSQFPNAKPTNSGLHANFVAMIQPKTPPVFGRFSRL